MDRYRWFQSSKYVCSVNVCSSFRPYWGISKIAAQDRNHSTKHWIPKTLKYWIKNVRGVNICFLCRAGTRENINRVNPTSFIQCREAQAYRFTRVSSLFLYSTIEFLMCLWHCICNKPFTTLSILKVEYCVMFPCVIPQVSQHHYDIYKAPSCKSRLIFSWHC